MAKRRTGEGPTRLRPQERKDADLSSPEAPRRLLNWKLDWRAYFRRFCQEHGGNPVDLGDKIVLPDGWSYSRTRYEGPEWPPPPEPQLSALMTRYWTERRGIVSQELKHLTFARTDLRDAMAARSAPLIRRAGVKDEATGERRWQSEELTLDAIDERIKWLVDDVALCDAELAKLKGVEHVVQS